MLAIKRELVLFLLFFGVLDCERKILNGKDITTDKRYVVYLVKAPLSPRKYDTWLCGGALVSSEFIVTSAACVNDVSYMYAIAGYKRYVKDANLEKDPCTKEKKKKVIYTCTSVSYEFDFEELEKWSNIDIALVRVESPYDFDDPSYIIQCSYTPSSIRINYEPRYQEAGTDAMVLGWGSTEKWRQQDNHLNFNQDMLQYTSIKIENKEECKRHYALYPNLVPVIEKYMICTISSGNINDAGETIRKSDHKAEGCTPQREKRKGKDYEGITCEEFESDEDMITDNTRREGAKINQTYSNSSIIRSPVNVTKTTNFNVTKMQSRRSHGFCQNDHGGPLVTWVGSHEVLIGIASVFTVSEESTCMGPFLYTSTQCNGAFLHCVLNITEMPEVKNPKKPAVGSRRTRCDSPPSEKGYDTVERHISWLHHPSGPAENERKSASIKFPPGMKDRHSQDHNGYDSGMPDRYSQDQEDKYDNNTYGGNFGYKKYERHVPETYGAGHHGMDKYGVEKKTPVKYGNTYGADNNEGDKKGVERHGPPNYDYASLRGKPAEGHKTDQFAGHDRFKSESNPEIEQPPEEPKEIFLMRPQRPLRS